jgi:hypothetical protein
VANVARINAILFICTSIKTRLSDVSIQAGKHLIVADRLPKSVDLICLNVARSAEMSPAGEARQIASLVADAINDNRRPKATAVFSHRSVAILKFFRAPLKPRPVLLIHLAPP